MESGGAVELKLRARTNAGGSVAHCASVRANNGVSDDNGRACLETMVEGAAAIRLTITRIDAANLEILVRGDLGTFCILQNSRDLTEWQDTEPFEILSAPARLSVPISSLSNQNFYRVVAP
jgi:hypothetical protein